MRKSCEQKIGQFLFGHLDKVQLSRDDAAPTRQTFSDPSRGHEASAAAAFLFSSSLCCMLNVCSGTEQLLSDRKSTCSAESAVCDSPGQMWVLEDSHSV